MAWNVVIAGGGFGGFHAARRLERRLPAHSAHVTLVTDVNFLTYTPFLPAAAGGHIDPRHVVAPLRELLPTPTSRCAASRARTPTAGASASRASAASRRSCPTTG